MSIKNHGRTYDLVVFGASGYTGTYLAEHVTEHLPANLKWALAGRSHDKLAKLAAELRGRNPDRIPPAIEPCGLNDEELGQLARKTAVLISTVGPFGAHGEPAFRACAENGTHYFDVTGEVAFVARMLAKYEAVAKASGAVMIPQCGIESAPPDLATWLVARLNRTQLHAQTAAVTAGLRVKAQPSGGTLATVLDAFSNFSLREMRDSYAPYALSPVPKANPHRGQVSLLTALTGFAYIPTLGGNLTTSMAGTTDAALIERTWGLLSSLPARKDQFYGPNFSYSEFMRVRSRLQAFVLHWGMTLGLLALAFVPPLRGFLKRRVFQPGQGPSREDSDRQKIECRAIGTPDLGTKAGKPTQQAYSRVSYNGGLYVLTSILVAQGALTLLEEDVGLEGGVYTPACLGQPFIDRLEKAGVSFETQMIAA